MHPVAESFIKTNKTLLSILEEYCQENPKEEQTSLMLAVRKALFLDKKQQILQLEKTRSSNIPMDKDLSIIHLLQWRVLEGQNSTSGNEQQIIHRKLKSLINKDTHPLLADFAHIKWSVANNITITKLIETVLLINYHRSPRYSFLLMELTGRLSVNGMLKGANNKIKDLLENTAQFDFADEKIKLYQLIDAIERFDEKAHQHYIDLDNEKGREVLQNSHNDSILTISHLLKNSEPPYWLTKMKPLSECKKDSLSILLLKQNKPVEAREAAFKHENDYIGKNIYSIFRYNKLRTELANKNDEAASRILSNLKEVHSTHYLDDFFQSRIYLLRNQLDLARKSFQAVQKSIKRYEASNRLKFELELSLEIKPNAMYDLMSNDTTIKTEIITNNEPSQPIGTKSLIGDSLGLQKIQEEIKKYANVKVPILVLGETGVGKEVVAKAIHDESSRREEPFIPINCSSIAETLLQSELFGHVSGAFTGAIKAHKGVFEEAGAGTVFLDEIGDMSSVTQQSLLRVLETNEIRPVGSSRTKKIHCKIIGATNADLENLVDKNTFRKDLYYRLKRLEIIIPPLRKRIKDIIPLALHFLSLERSDNKTPELSSVSKEKLEEHHWPGNVRELRNEIERQRLFHAEKLFYNGDEFDFNNDKSFNKKTKENNETKKTATNTPSKLNRYERIIIIKEIFQKQQRVSRLELVRELNIAPTTASTDLKILITEGFIQKKEPSSSPRTHYFEINP